MILRWRLATIFSCIQYIVDVKGKLPSVVYVFANTIIYKRL